MLWLGPQIHAELALQIDLLNLKFDLLVLLVELQRCLIYLEGFEGLL